MLDDIIRTKAITRNTVIWHFQSIFGVGGNNSHTKNFIHLLIIFCRQSISYFTKVTNIQTLYLIERYFGRETSIWCSKVSEVEFDRLSQSEFIIFTNY